MALTNRTTQRKPQPETYEELPLSASPLAGKCCQKCEKPLRDSVKFCPSCGFPVTPGTPGEQPGRFCFGCAAAILQEDTHCPLCGRAKQERDDNLWETKLDEGRIRKLLTEAGLYQEQAKVLDDIDVLEEVNWCRLELWGITLAKYFVGLMSRPEIYDLLRSLTPDNYTSSFFRHATKIQGYPRTVKNSQLARYITHTAMVKWLYVYAVKQGYICEDRSFSRPALHYFAAKWHTTLDDLQVLQVTVSFYEYGREAWEMAIKSGYGGVQVSRQENNLSAVVRTYSSFEQDTLSWWEHCKPERVTASANDKPEDEKPDRQPTILPKYCGLCRTPAIPKAKYCTHCSGLLVRAKLQEEGFWKTFTTAGFVYVSWAREDSIHYSGFCPGCGKRVFTLEGHPAKFCEVCSSPLSLFSPKSCGQVYCHNCGQCVYPEAQQFCKNCGAKLPDMPASVPWEVPPSRIVEGSVTSRLLPPRPIGALPAGGTTWGDMKETDEQIRRVKACDRHEEAVPVARQSDPPPALPLCQQCGRMPVRKQGATFCASCLEKPWPQYPLVQRTQLALKRRTL